MTPLVLGMALCLMLVGAGVIAAGSAHLARQSLQHHCDGAAAAAAEGALGVAAADGTVLGADDRAREYLRLRVPDAIVSVQVLADGVVLHCTRRASVALGALFASGEIDVAATSVARITLDLT